MKLLATDMDGTLIFRDENNNAYIKEKDEKAIREFLSLGHLMGVCTGRSASGARENVEQFAFDFYITCSGAAIFDKDYQLIYSQYMSRDLIYQIFKKVNQEQLYFIGQDGQYYVYNHPSPNDFFNAITSFEDLRFDHFLGLSIEIHDTNALTELRLELEKEFGDLISINQNVDALDIVAKGVSKATGVKFIQQYFGLNDQDVHTIGDSYNDLPMLEAVENSFTFDYSPIQIQKQTKYVVDSLAKAIQIIISK